MILKLFEQNSLICPIAIVAAYGGSSYDDHRVSISCCIWNFRSNVLQLVVTSIRDYMNKMARGKDVDDEQAERGSRRDSMV